MTKTRVLLITAVLIGVLSTAGIAAAETISMVVPWQGQGQLFPIDVDKLRFIGSVEGIAYAESEEGVMNEAFVRCPIVQDMDAASGHTSATGNCVFSVGPNDTVFAEIRCEGTRGLCKGEFTITGGTGNFAGISGSGSMTARSPVHALAQNVSDGTVMEAVIGILQLPALKIRLR